MDPAALKMLLVGLHGIIIGLAMLLTYRNLVDLWQNRHTQVWRVSGSNALVGTGVVLCFFETGKLVVGAPGVEPNTDAIVFTIGVVCIGLGFLGLIVWYRRVRKERIALAQNEKGGES